MTLRCLLVVALGAVGGLVWAPRDAAACSCLYRATPCQAVRAPVVFVGEVLAVNERGRDIRHRMRVVRAVKGVHTGATTDVWSDTSSCGTRLEAGRRYVIATRSSGGRLSIGACDWLEALAPGEPEPELPPVPGRVYGRIFSDAPDGFSDPVPAAGARLWLDLPAGRVTAVSDRFGRFVFADVPAGSHRLGVDAGRRLDLAGPRRVEMPPAAGCVASYVFLRPSGELAGRVVHADGRPAFGVVVSLLHAARPGSEPPRHAATTTAGADGRFTFGGVDAGTYVVAVNPGDRPSLRAPFAATWFGGATRSSATRLRVAFGRPTALAPPLVLPRPLQTKAVPVSVRCRDGSTPPFVEAVAAGVGGAADVESASARGGDLILTLLRDRSYAVVVTPVIPCDAQGPRGPSPRGALPPVVVPAGTAVRPMALVAPFTGCTAPR